MILQFSKGYKLKFCLEELSKLKNSLAIKIGKIKGDVNNIKDNVTPF